MMRLRHKLLIHAFGVFDQLVLIATLAMVVALIQGHGRISYLRDICVAGESYVSAFGAMLLVLCWARIFRYIVCYDANRFIPTMASIRDILKATALCTLVLLLVALIFSVHILSAGVVLAFWVMSSLVGICSRVMVRVMLTKLRSSGLNCRYVVFVGTGKRACHLARGIEAQPELGYYLAGFIAENGETSLADAKAPAHWKILGRISEFKSFLEKGPVDEVMVCLPMREKLKEIYKIIQLCHDLGVVVRVLPDQQDSQMFAAGQVETFEGDWAVTFFREDLLWQLLFKRAMDMTVSATTLILLSPLLALVALLIKLTTPGPVFFKQHRVGMNKRTFTLIKFRSMYVDAEQRKADLAALNEVDGPVFKIKNDPRITPLGRIIRKTSIDELPQLLNVLRGEMSLVGPRPPLPSEVDQYDWIYRRRLSIKPGLTCLWQISGRSNLPFARWMELDREYTEKWSIWLDIKILFKTVPVVLSGNGAS
jgi:exopolysaccharide biosynthesis polyprenyl glycosylphosphotransferase